MQLPFPVRYLQIVAGQEINLPTRSPSPLPSPEH